MAHAAAESSNDRRDVAGGESRFWTLEIRYRAVDSSRSCKTPNHSHSIINEPTKPLICNAPEAARQKFTVISTVKVRSISIGAGLQAIRSELTFRDLSTSIDSRDHHGLHRRASVSVRATTKKAWHQTRQVIVA
jgi:hypothetical protein